MFNSDRVGWWLGDDGELVRPDPSNARRFVGNDPTNATDPTGLYLIATDDVATEYLKWLRGDKNNVFSKADGMAGPGLTEKQVVARTLPNGAVLFMSTGDGAEKATAAAKNYKQDLASTLTDLSSGINLLMSFEEDKDGPYTVGGKKMKLSLKEDPKLLLWIQNWVNAGGTVEKADEKSGPDVLDWFAEDLVLHMKQRVENNRLLFGGFVHQAADLMSHKWIDFGGPRTGRGVNTVVLNSKVLTKNELGNIALLVIGRIWPTGDWSEFWSDFALNRGIVGKKDESTLKILKNDALKDPVNGVAVLGYALIPDYRKAQFGKWKPGEFLWRAENLAAFGVGYEIADRFLKKINSNLDEARKQIDKDVETEVGRAKLVGLMKETLHELFDGGKKADDALLAAMNRYYDLQPSQNGAKGPMTINTISFTPNFGGFNVQSLDYKSAGRFKGPSSIGMAGEIKKAWEKYREGGGTLNLAADRQLIV
jgi:hypothetical protein